MSRLDTLSAMANPILRAIKDAFRPQTTESDSRTRWFGFLPSDTDRQLLQRGNGATDINNRRGFRQLVVLGRNRVSLYPTCFLEKTAVIDTS